MPTKIWLCIDGIKTWLLCNVIAQNIPQGLYTFNPVFWGSDVLSINPDGTVKHATQGASGTGEVFLIAADVALITPVQPVTPASQVYGLKWVAAAA